MQSVRILRALWRRRIALCVAAAVALICGFLAAYHVSFPPERRSYDVGVASASLLVDTPKSQVVEVDPRGSDTLGVRATVLANLMVDGEIKSAIARHLGMAPNRLIGSSLASGVPAPVTPLTPLNARSYSYTTGVALTSDMTTLPIIRVQAQAPDVGQAIRVANGVVAGLGEYLDSKATDETVAATRRLRMRPLGTAQGHVATRGPGRKVALGVAIFVFLAGCALILAVAGIARGWRAAASSEQDEVAPASPPDALREDEVAEPRASAAERRTEGAGVRAW